VDLGDALDRIVLDRLALPAVGRGLLVGHVHAAGGRMAVNHRDPAIGTPADRIESAHTVDPPPFAMHSRLNWSHFECSGDPFLRPRALSRPIFFAASAPQSFLSSVIPPPSPPPPPEEAHSVASLMTSSSCCSALS